MTKEEMLDHEIPIDSEGDMVYSEEEVKAAMDLWAKQQCIAFVDFIRLKSVADGSPKRLYIPDGNRYTTEQLYELFIMQTENK